MKFEEAIEILGQEEQLSESELEEKGFYGEGMYLETSFDSHETAPIMNSFFDSQTLDPHEQEVLLDNLKELVKALDIAVNKLRNVNEFSVEQGDFRFWQD